MKAPVPHTAVINALEKAFAVLVEAKSDERSAIITVSDCAREIAGPHADEVSYHAFRYLALHWFGTGYWGRIACVARALDDAHADLEG